MTYSNELCNSLILQFYIPIYLQTRRKHTMHGHPSEFAQSQSSLQKFLLRKTSAHVMSSSPNLAGRKTSGNTASSSANLAVNKPITHELPSSSNLAEKATSAQNIPSSASIAESNSEQASTARIRTTSLNETTSTAKFTID